LLASLIECFIILPNHMSHALSTVGQRKWYDAPSHYFNVGFNWFRNGIFRWFMRWVLVFRYPVLALLVLALASQLALFNKGEVRWRFFNAPERSSLSANIAMLPTATRQDTRDMVRELQRAVAEVSKTAQKEHGLNPITFVLAEVGGTTGRGIAGTDTKDKSLLGSLAIELIDADARPDYSAFEILADIKAAVKKHPKLEIMSFRRHYSGPGGDTLDVQFYGADATTLKAAAEALKQAVSRYPEVTGVEDNLPYDKQELVLELTAQGKALGFSIDDIGRELRNRLNGIEAASFPVGAHTGKITVRLPESELGRGFLQNTHLRSKTGVYVALSDIVSVKTQLGFSVVLRENGIPRISVNGAISQDDAARADLIENDIRDNILPRIQRETGVEWQLGGQAEQEQDFLSDAMLGFGLCLLGIYLTLTWIFASWTRPLVVMAVIPFGLIGTIYGHYVWEVPLSMFSVVGLIGMSGIIINDSIVLVTTIDEYAENRGLFPAIVDAVSDRLRPVLLTTLTTVLGLLPLMYESSRQALFLKPTVITLCFGLGFGLLVVLLVVPALVVVQKDVNRLFTSYRRSLSGAAKGPHRVIMALATLASGGLLAASVGYLVVTGTLAPWIAALPVLGTLSGSVAAMAVLFVGLSGILLAALVLSAVVKRPTLRNP
jgi:multidrug efflux pump subunit AcrB